MHRLTALGLTAALLASLGGTASAADPGDGGTPPNLDSGFRRWNGIPPERFKPPAPPSAIERAEKRAKETAAAMRDQEQATLLRRLAVCDALLQIALQTSDDELAKQAELLQKKAETVWKHKTGTRLMSDADEPRTDRKDGKQIAKQEGKR